MTVEVSTTISEKLDNLSLSIPNINVNDKLAGTKYSTAEIVKILSENSDEFAEIYKKNKITNVSNLKLRKIHFLKINDKVLYNGCL